MIRSRRRLRVLLRVLSTRPPKRSNTDLELQIPPTPLYRLTAAATIGIRFRAATLRSSNIDETLVVNVPVAAAPIEAAYFSGGTLLTHDSAAHRDRRTAANMASSSYTLEVTLGASSGYALSAALDAATLRAGFASTPHQAAGFEAVVRSTLTFVRTSARVLTITIPAASGYSLTSPETLTFTLPAAATVPATMHGLVVEPSLVIDPITTDYTSGDVHVTLGGGLANDMSERVLREARGNYLELVLQRGHTWVKADVLRERQLCVPPPHAPPLPPLFPPPPAPLAPY